MTATNLAGTANAESAPVAVTSPPPPPPPGPTPSADTTAPAVSLAVPRQKLGAVISKGLRVRADSSEPCRLLVKLYLGKLLIGTASRSLARATPTRTAISAFAVKLTAKGKAKLRRLSRATLTVRAAGADAAGNTGTAVRKVTLRR